MPHPLLAAPDHPACPIHLVSREGWPALRDTLPPLARAFAEAQGYEPKPGRTLALPGPDGGLAAILFGHAPDEADPLAVGSLPGVLPEGVYRFETALADADLATLGWLMGGYRFTRYKPREEKLARLVPPLGVEVDEVTRVAEAVAFGRDLVNTPANDLTPAGIEEAARSLGERHAASVSAIVGDDLLANRLPMIHAVGRASATPPRLVDLCWGDEGHPKVTLVGKGVAFDTGGLDIKPSAAMLLMKKDMGGAAAALALAAMVMGAGLPIRLRVLVPAVENAIGGDAFRPGDVLPSRKGLNVEIGNTDAEGRLILADALSLACEEKPDLLLDFSTLTGAARIALGPDLPALFTHDDALAADLARAGQAQGDPLWRLPLWAPYASMLDSKVADINHVSSGPFAGAITAALFLSRFVEGAGAHAHLDLYAWNPKPRPGRPEGGEVQTARAVYALLKERYHP